MKRAQRLSDRVFAATVDVRAGECERHRRYANKPGARRGARAHVRAWARGELWCYKCRAGLVPNLFPCASHWHWGHKRPKGVRRKMANDERVRLPDDQYEGMVDIVESHVAGFVQALTAVPMHDMVIGEAQQRANEGRDGKGLTRLRKAYEKLAYEAQALAERCGDPATPDRVLDPRRRG